MPWQNMLNENMTTAEQLQKHIFFCEEHLEQLQRISKRFPFSIPPYYLSLIDPSDPHDPIRKMCVPALDELDPGGRLDTSGEASNTVLTGLQHKYRQTALVLSTNACAMYCRHCFRKRLVGREDRETRPRRDKILAYIRKHHEISNVLLSGGDALLNPTPVLHEYLEELSGMEHLDAIRICSRTPVVLPMRIYMDQKLLDLFKEYGAQKRLYLVTQFNHPRELSPLAQRALDALQECGVMVRNQTVLLHGVNDHGPTLGKLLKELVRRGVVPYYVFQCRPVTGVKNNFQVPIAHAYSIVEEAKQMQNGLGKAFRYVLSHETGKIEILGPVGNRRWLFKYHQAKTREDQGRLFSVTLRPGQCWLGGKDVREIPWENAEDFVGASA